MHNILYLTHVAWGWILQRPQFIAEELSHDNIVDYFYVKSNRFRRANRVLRKENLTVKGFRFWPFERIPFIHLKWLDQINKFYFYLSKIDFSYYDIIWITDPRFYFLIKNKIEGKKLVYDCMDDMLEFPYIKRFPQLLKYVKESEKQLMYDADIVICSAKSLQNKIFTRYGIHRNIEIVNNAITDDIINYSIEGENLPPNSLVYIGTISEWFDFKSVIYSLERHPNLNVLLYGPIRMSNQPQHERLIYKGSISHNKILSVMSKAKGLIMPFVENELVESVNPVKLYEYIYSGKPVCATRYGESEKFEDYVFLFKGKEEFDSFVEKVLYGDIHTDCRLMRDFALQNTWHNRAEQIRKILSYQ